MGLHHIHQLALDTSRFPYNACRCTRVPRTNFTASSRLPSTFVSAMSYLSIRWVPSGFNGHRFEHVTALDIPLTLFSVLSYKIIGGYALGASNKSKEASAREPAGQALLLASRVAEMHPYQSGSSGGTNPGGMTSNCSNAITALHATIPSEDTDQPLASTT